MSDHNDLPPEQPGFNFEIIWRVLLEKAWLIVVCFVLAVFATGAYLNQAPRIYSATAVLQVEQMEQRVVKIDVVQQEDLRTPDTLKTIEQSLTSRSVLERVSDANGLTNDARLVDRKTGQKPAREQLVGMLAGTVSAKMRRGTRLIDVTMAHTVPELTAEIANSVVKEYIRLTVDQQAASTQVANEFLMEEAARLKKKLAESENALQTYKEKTKSVSFEDKQNIVVQKLRELSLRVTEAKSDRLRLEAEWRQLEQVGTNLDSLSVVPALANDPGISSIRLEISKLEADFANLKQRYKQKHPKYIQMVSQIAEWQRTLTNAMSKLPQTIRLAYENAKTSEEALEQALREQEAAALELNKLEIQYNVLAREVEANRSLYEAVFQRVNETALAKNLEPNKIRIVQAAYTPTRPISPQKTRVLALGLVGGLMGGIMLALLLNAMDRSLKTVDQTEAYLNLPVLSVVPHIKRLKEGKGSLIVTENSRSSGAESFRSLRTSLSMLGKEEQRKVFLFTSALPQEGKTFCSLNCAASLAQAGLRTILIDCDLRRPTVEAALLGKRSSKPGVTDLLTEKAKFFDAVQGTDIENFCFISAGTTAPNPAELLAQKGFDEIVDEALAHFERVVIDSAPVHAVSDTLLVLNRVQTVCLVARACKTPHKSILRAVQILQNAKAPLAGVVLNRLPLRRGLSYYYHGYYDYSYRGEYSQKGVYGA